MHPSEGVLDLLIVWKLSPVKVSARKHRLCCIAFVQATHAAMTCCS